jgi:hypothetical protein
MDSYTPFGYLANPYHRARSWSDVEGGLLRSCDDLVGFGWVEPTARRPTLEAAIVVALRWVDRLYLRRADFGRLGYASRHHTSRLFSFDWTLDDVSARLAFTLLDRNRLVAELALDNPGPLPTAVEISCFALVRAKDGRWSASEAPFGWRLADGRSGRTFGFATDAADGAGLRPGDVADLADELIAADGSAAGYRFALTLPGHATWSARFCLARDAAVAQTPDGAQAAGSRLRDQRAADDAFYRDVALPTGDWPSEWKRGWVYDLETTRACIYPAGGVFQHEWPSWMLSWPRVVVAEGTLDALRFSYAAPERALGLVRTLFGEAPAANVPCVFQGGEPNMVAKDGAVCGTSPAWCLPFYNLWLLFCRTGDRAWLADLYPHLEAYLDFWLRERVDEEGWVVYKCTWEAGEDCTPRLDPAAEGDEVISRYVRPVELQATMALSAQVLKRFATVMGDAEAAARWGRVAEDYAARTGQLWDEATGRYRDWDKRTGQFLAAGGKPAYWQTDPVRFSALSLTPIIAGIPTAAQRERLRTEIDFYDAAPWCLWPSWSYVVAESATVAGWHGFAAQFAEGIVDRVYRANDRRTLAEASRPTPGTAPEFWPLDLARFDGSDCYGWGATTTSLWVRQIFGFLDGTHAAEDSFRLAPGLPETMLQPGRRYGFRGLPYRGRRLDVGYEVTPGGLMATVGDQAGTRFVAYAADGRSVAVDYEPHMGLSRFKVEGGQATQVVVVP